MTRSASSNRPPAGGGARAGDRLSAGVAPVERRGSAVARSLASQ